MNMKPNNQSGMVSILTMLFFMVFVSIIVTGFLRIMNYDQVQTVDSDLSASALAAAQSGIEDGKRILLYCNTDAPSGGKGSPACQRIMNSKDSCSALSTDVGAINMTALRSALRITMSGNQFVVGAPASQFQQYYTCLTINSDTPQIAKRLNGERSSIIPLTTTNPNELDKLQLNWRADTDLYAVTNPSTQLPPRAQWMTSPTTKKPPILRVQLIPYSFPLNLDAVESMSRTIFVVPSNISPTAVNMTSIDQRGATGQLRPSPSSPIAYASCTAPMGGGYSCSQSIEGLSGIGSQYYMKVSMLYGNETMLNVTATNVANTSVLFRGVQPEIDVTGRTNDVFRRVKARVSYGMPSITFPEYALEANNICKDMIVSVSSASWDKCHDIPVTPPPDPGPCKVGANYIVNGDFSVLPGPGYQIDPAARFESDLPNRGTDAYPDDSGANGSSPGWTGGFSIQTRDNWYSFMGLTLHATPFPGDPSRSVPAARNYFYSNPNQNKYQPKGTYSTFSGVLWRQKITGLKPYTKYEFLGYFNNIIHPPGNASTDPRIRLRVDGKDTTSPVVVKVVPDEWIPVTMPFITGNQTEATLEIYDDANDVNGDDFGMTGLNFYECE